MSGWGFFTRDGEDAMIFYCCESASKIDWEIWRQGTGGNLLGFGLHKSSLKIDLVGIALSVI